MNIVTIAAILANLRAQLQSQVPPLDAYIVPSGDAHHSEYTAACDQRRAYVSGFTGSAGTAVVTAQYAALWTDSRYFIQAEAELDSTLWTLMRQGNPGVPSMTAWLVQNLTANARVGVDPSLYSKTEWDSLSNELRINGKTLVAVESNLVDVVWTADTVNPRPPCSTQNVAALGLEYAGKSTEDKLTDIRAQMTANGAKILVISELDEVAWLLNLRGRDIQYNPFFFAYVIIQETSFRVFVDPAKLSNLSPATMASFTAIGGTFVAYEGVATFLHDQALADTTPTAGKVWVSKNCNYLLVNRLLSDAAFNADRLIVRLTPIAVMKAIKNAVETQGMINCHVRDSAAVVEYFAWLEDEINNKGVTTITQISGATKLAEFRQVKENFQDLSFGSISASGLNAALPHYDPTPETNRNLTTSEIYLVDSGGQYLDGTTDVTRTIYFGEPNEEIVNAFTRVLKGMIALRTAIFPRRSPGSALDTLARKFLWDVHLNFGHGTGHGIGAYGGVHEGPFSISTRTGTDDPGLDVNMFTSDEPGFYKEGDFGIRIENIIRVVNTSDPGYVTFEDVTLVPIQQKLIDVTLLTDEEITYLNAYHAKVRTQIGDYLRTKQNTQLAINYLDRETAPLTASAALLKAPLLAVVLAWVASKCLV